MTDRHGAFVLDRPTDALYALDVYGPRLARLDAIADARTRLLEPHLIRHHWRPWESVPVSKRLHKPTPQMPITRKQRWANLAFIVACVFIIGVVVYNVAVRP